jgi:hypothetical protein
MEEQIAPSIPVPENFETPSTATPNFPPNITTATSNFSPTITPELINLMKNRAREEAIRITLEQRQATPAPQLQVPQDFQRPPQVVYVRRNLTFAELILTVFLACGLVLGVQTGWHFGSQLLQRIEIKVK